MIPGGDNDDAVNVVDVWLQDHPEEAPWERAEMSSPLVDALVEDGAVNRKRFNGAEAPTHF